MNQGLNTCPAGPQAVAGGGGTPALHVPYRTPLRLGRINFILDLLRVVEPRHPTVYAVGWLGPTCSVAASLGSYRLGTTDCIRFTRN